jgi:hypothetical protein
MLYDPRWTNDDITLNNFRLYCEAQKPKKRYSHPFKDKCAVGKFLQDTGHHMLLRAHWPNHPVLYKADNLAQQSPWTFGALAIRVREFQRIAKVPF